MQVFRRLQYVHGYHGCYGQVQRYVHKHRRRHRETFIPLGHLPGQRLEADFGHIHVDFPDGRRQIPFLVTVWAYSNAPFVLALPFERTEAILEGMVRAFEFFGCVLKEVWWDNPRIVATFILQGRERRLHPRHAELASHYVFDLLFCMPARGKEKPDAEGTVADPRPASSGWPCARSAPPRRDASDGVRMFPMPGVERPVVARSLAIERKACYTNIVCFSRAVRSERHSWNTADEYRLRAGTSRSPNHGTRGRLF